MRQLKCNKTDLTFIGPCIFAEYNQQDATFHNLFIYVRRSTCFRRFFSQSSGDQNCTYSVRYWSDKYLTLYVQFWAPDDGRKNRLKNVERLTEINKLWNVASCWLYTLKNKTGHKTHFIPDANWDMFQHQGSIIRAFNNNNNNKVPLVQHVIFVEKCGKLEDVLYEYLKKLA